MPGALFPIIHQGRYGYIDGAGAVILKPEYRAAGSFAGGLAPVIKERWWCYIDRAGAVVIPGPYSLAEPFSEGLASVSDTQGRCFYIDTTGREIISPETIVAENDRANEAYSFSDGIAAIRCYATLYFINRRGKVLFKREDVSSNMPAIIASDGLIPFGIKSGDSSKFGFLNYKGVIVIKPRYDLVTGFSEGRALVGTKKEKRFMPSDISAKYKRHEPYPVWFYTMKYIDKNGRTILMAGTGPEEATAAFSGGLTVAKKNGRRCYINAHGSTVLAPDYDMLGPYINGLACVARQVPKDLLPGPVVSAYINRTGTCVWQDTGFIVDCGHGRFGFLRH